MIDIDYRVPPKSWAIIENSANALRRAVGLDDEPFTPVINILEKVLQNQMGLVEMLIEDDADMDGALGYSSPDGSFIKLSHTTYERACSGDGRARFTVAHELGHWILHSRVPLARLNKPSDAKHFERAEPQANHFAACLLMPQQFILPQDEEFDLITRFGVSNHSASIRLDKLFGR